MSLVVAFDLDDTLYEEMTFVRSGFSAVAQQAWREYGLDPASSIETMLRLERAIGRGKVFDQWLAAHGLASAHAVKRCVAVYRSHDPQIVLDPEARKVLRELSGYRKYLVTDGNKNVQARKVKALGLSGEFEGVYITHRYGIRHAKPSLYCFEKIRERERCQWNDIVYVGDNPSKDFVGLNGVGANTIRVLRGPYRSIEAAPGYDAQTRIERLSLLPGALKELGVGVKCG